MISKQVAIARARFILASGLRVRSIHARSWRSNRPLNGPSLSLPLGDDGIPRQLCGNEYRAMGSVAVEVWRSHPSSQVQQLLQFTDESVGRILECGHRFRVLMNIGFIFRGAGQ